MSGSETDFYKKLKWLTFFRLLFTTLLLGSTIVLQISERSSPLAKPLLGIYGLIAGIFVLSICYAMILKFFLFPEPGRTEAEKKIWKGPFAAYIQISIDTVIVSLIIFMTGNFSSVFSFLYLLVIIYASMLIFRKGSMIIAALCSLEYGIMVFLEFYRILKPFNMDGDTAPGIDSPWSYVLYKIIMIMVACFAVAFLSSLLSEQERRTQKKLLTLEDHVKRVEKMAAIGEMAAGLAHEIRNPLASLRGSVQLLREDIRCNPEQDKLMQIVVRETDRLGSLVTDFLLFAKPPAGRVKIFDLGEAISETVTIFEKDSIHNENIEIIKEIAAGIGTEMDPSHLHQILWNLLLNAAEAVKDNGYIRIRMYSARNRHVAVVEISDNGCGISEELMKTIFNPFVTTKPGGTGLGLAIVHRIAASYNGTLEVESEVGKGTVFTLKLKQTNLSHRHSAT